jgi:hypothetical protein
MRLFDRFRNAWAAFKRNDSRFCGLTFGVDVRKCSECDRTKKPQVAYICDRKECNVCSYPECKHTTDIKHAVNFINDIDDKWSEKED